MEAGRVIARIVVAVLATLGAFARAAAPRALDAPVGHAAATCADYPNQAAAQLAHDTHDARWHDDPVAALYELGGGIEETGRTRVLAPLDLSHETSLRRVLHAT